MSFLLRAALVIGTLSYFALRKDGAAPVPPAAAPLAGSVPALAEALPAAFQALPAEARERIAREGLAELSRRLSVPPSQDTLAEADRRPAWRGAEAR
ncbi:hypothetical protein [Methylobacterium durans]|uniref:Uncharacterized protein n=1 Tax=Methylobacterium durans TaxID=2202825 RepID=A0A2U8WEI7_9HYPH|nr:hypothetical protein [Methylobacterium durans]AWN44449.1 hypothetical protein DK389_08930 [Methylobacterium durans]